MPEHARDNEAVSDDSTEIAAADLTLGLALPWIPRLITQSGVAPLSGVAQTLSKTPMRELSRGEYESEATPAAVLLAGLTIDYGSAAGVSLGDLLPGLATAEGAPSIAVRGTRSRNVLIRMSANSWQAVARLTPGQLQAQPNIGKKSVKEIVVAATEEWANARTTASTPLPDSTPAHRAADGRNETPVVGILGALLPWLQALPPPDEAQTEIHDAWAIVRDAPLAGSTNQSAAWSKMPGETAIDRDLLAHRIYPVGKVRTLDVIGTAHDLTRERIRQLEKRLREQLALFFASAEAAELRHIASKLRKEMGSLAYREDLPREVISTWETAAEDSEAGLHARALLVLAGAYSVQGPWIADRDTEDLFTELREQLLKDSDDGVVDPIDLERLATKVGISERRADEFAAALQIVRCEGKLILWQGSQDDKGVRILRAAGEPLTRQRFIEVVNEITTLTGETVSEKGFFQRIQADDRVRRLGKDSYGLDEWGGEEYEGIITEMLQAIAANDDAITVEELAAMLEAKFDVSSNSVRMYSDGPQFTVDSDGIIRKATKAPAGKARRPLGLSKRCFRLEDGWAYRRAVDHDVLRGSGGGLPLAFATALKVPPGGSMRLRSPYGEIHASWPAHITHIGSLRPAALALGAVEGDRLFVVSIGEGEVDVRLVTHAECASRTGLERLAAECGRPGAQDPLKAVALALSLEDSNADLATAIRIRLAERGENDLVALMDDHGDDGDDLLDELASLGG